MFFGMRKHENHAKNIPYASSVEDVEGPPKLASANTIHLKVFAPLIQCSVLYSTCTCT